VGAREFAKKNFCIYADRRTLRNYTMEYYIFFFAARRRQVRGPASRSLWTGLSLIVCFRG